MTIQDNLKKGNQILKTSPTPLLDAEVLLSSILKKDKSFLYSHPEYILTKQQQDKYDKHLNRRKKQEPIAYILERKDFYGLTFKVNRNVLIPRPETEELVDKVINYIKDNKLKKITVLDIGTGSGCIAITLKKLIPHLNIIASDKYSSALKVAKQNLKLNTVKIKLIQSDLLKKIKTNPDIILANLPYLKGNEKHGSIKFEPKSALYGDLELFEKLFKQIKELKKTPQLVILEINTLLSKQTLKLAKEYFTNCNLEKDLSGKDRFLRIEKPHTCDY